MYLITVSHIGTIVEYVFQEGRTGVGGGGACTSNIRNVLSSAVYKHISCSDQYEC